MFQYNCSGDYQSKCIFFFLFFRNIKIRAVAILKISASVLSPGRQRKLENVNLRTQTCNGWPNGLARRRKFNASSKKAISVQPCTCARTKENNTETNLRRLALGGQAVKNLRSLAYKFELDQSERKSSQAIARTHKSWPNGVAS